MHYNINFPNLGIHLTHVGKSITVFGFEIAFYGMIIGCAILLGFLIASYEAKRTGQNPENYLDMGMIGVICGIAGARLFYVIFSWDLYKDNLLDILNLRMGGLAIYGGVIGAVITVFVCARIKKLCAPQIFDTIALALLNGQMLGRWGNFFNREAFGGYTNSLLAMQVPMDAVRDSDVTDTMLENMKVIDNVSYIQVHPTFLYESLWCCGLLILLILYRKHKKYEGEVFLLYLFGYGLGRVWIEGLRTDQLIIPGLDLPVSQLLAGIIVVVTGALLLFLRKHHEKVPFLIKGLKSEKLGDEPEGRDASGKQGEL